MSNPERSFARIDTALKGHMRILSDGRLIPLFSCGMACAPMRFPDNARSALPDSLVQFLEAMDDKLNSILTILNQQSLHEDFPLSVLVHDISGAGLRFTTNHAVGEGTAVEIVVALGVHPQVLASTTGVIIRRDEHCGQDLWVVEFRELRDSEREKIIHYVVAQQREQLRVRRMASTS
jgi:hypothetical protein